MVSKPEDLVRTIAGKGVRDSRLLDAVRAVPRAGFVPAGLAGQAYLGEILTSRAAPRVSKINGREVVTIRTYRSIGLSLLTYRQASIMKEYGAVTRT